MTVWRIQNFNLMLTFNRGEDKDVRITECPDIRSECLSGCLCGCPEFEIFFPLKFFSFFFFACRQKILQNYNGFHLKLRTSTRTSSRMSIECLSNVFADVYPSVLRKVFTTSVSYSAHFLKLRHTSQQFYHKNLFTCEPKSCPLS